MSTTYYICRKHEYERSEAISSYTDRIRRTLFSYLDASLPPKLKDDVHLTDDLEEAMQKVMDEYAGGIASNYQFNEKQLKLAEEKIARLNELAEQIGAEDMHELLFAYELKERLLVCQVLIEHLKSRKETRWHSFNENLDHPETDQKFEKYVNSRMEDGKIRILFRDLVKGDTYEHTNS